jgi:hypothetical protein
VQLDQVVLRREFVGFVLVAVDSIRGSYVNSDEIRDTIDV